MLASFEYQSQVIGMMHSHMRMSSKVIQKYLDNRLEIVEDQGHCPLKSRYGIIKAKRHFPICKRSPRKNKCSLMLVLRFNLYLIVSRKAIHKGKNLATHTLIQNLINKWCGKLSLGQAWFKSWKSVHMQITPCFLSTGTGFETHSIKGMG